MINWYSIGFSALWIVGLSFEIAVLSFSCYLTTQQRLRITQVLETSPFRTLIGIGLVFFCIGMTGTAATIWERGAWAALSLISIFWILKGKKARKKRSGG